MNHDGVVVSRCSGAPPAVDNRRPRGRNDTVTHLGNETVSRNETVSHLGNETVSRNETVSHLGNETVSRNETVSHLGNETVSQLGTCLLYTSPSPRD